MLREVGLIALLGLIGTLCRYGLSGIVQKLCGGHFPWGTWAVNAVGCFLFALVWTLAEERLVIGGQKRFIVLVGFMGAFTTFSTYAFETGEFLRDSEWILAAANVLGQNGVGVICIFLGFAAARWL